MGNKEFGTEYRVAQQETIQQMCWLQYGVHTSNRSIQ